MIRILTGKQAINIKSVSRAAFRVKLYSVLNLINLMKTFYKIENAILNFL
ncbi:MAG: hypothetical protein AVDCRST_MAG95-2238 [uncultured Adhaeribacter sp.]|uniref:Uncharacterized protein n=1 Tax=uncultured Adhaeribacter sp. TaxID=448109 RepID=A0A6J4ISF2_9BACT|nr:MAG: hypothetical protein AVDCRST_MAG95-2238 [uncultured Adhaeribacter sp.]